VSLRLAVPKGASRPRMWTVGVETSSGDFNRWD